MALLDIAVDSKPPPAASGHGLATKHWASAKRAVSTGQRRAALTWTTSSMAPAARSLSWIWPQHAPCQGDVKQELTTPQHNQLARQAPRARPDVCGFLRLLSGAGVSGLGTIA